MSGFWWPSISSKVDRIAAAGSRHRERFRRSNIRLVLSYCYTIITGRKKARDLLAAFGASLTLDGDAVSGSTVLFERMRLCSHGASIREVFERLYLEKYQHVILLMHRQLMDAPSHGVSQEFRRQLLFAAARVFSQNNAAESAFNLCNVLRSSEVDRRRFARDQIDGLDFLFVHTALRSGRSSIALEYLKRRLVDRPADWNTHYHIGLILLPTDRGQALQHFDAAYRICPDMPIDARLYIAEARMADGDSSGAQAVLNAILQRGPANDECLLGFANLMQYLDRPDARRGYLGDYFDGFGLDSEPVRQIHSGNPLSVAQSMRQGSRDHPLVTVIMTTWNAARTVAFAAESVLRQSCGNVELIIVDDASSDDTGRILKALEAADSRIGVLFNERNRGTYFSKNRAIEVARGEFITCHDSDDWMHPQHIEKHLAAAQAGVVTSVSKWIRMDPSGRVVVRRGGTYLHENPASTFFHRSVVSRAGYFDSVRAAADSEFTARIRANYGPAAVAELDLPLAIGLQHEASLTAAGATAFDEHRHSAVRLRYCEAWLRWHIDCLRDRRPLYLPFPQTERAFEAPAEMTSS